MRAALASFLVASALLSACAPMPAPAPLPAPPPGPSVPDAAADTCNARIHAGLVNQNVQALERVYILGPIRIIRPGEAITMDDMAGRINFELDPFDQIARIFCG